MELRVLDGGDPRDCATWVELWQRWPDREVMAHPEFVRLFARKGDLVLAATVRTELGGVLYPFILRPLSAEPWTPPGQAGCDLTSAYGYGGPFAWNLTPEEARSFWSQFDRWARARQVVTSFARLSLFPYQLLPFDGLVVVNSPNVVRSLELSDEDLWNDYAPKVRQNVRRARSRGCSVEVDPDGARFEEFHHVYTATMQRRSASSYYFFSREFFEPLLQRLKGHFVFFHVAHADRLVSSELVLLSQRHAYFFLGGTLADAFDLRPGDLLQHESFRWCRSAGKRALVLGGGHRSSEGLLKYKKAFAPGGEVPFRVGMKIHDRDLTEQLVEARRRWERGRGVDWQPEAGFFPVYRSG
ncbi:MAG: GNAT family N-acetyltransferase [Candidatus Rokuibacteriota bacterium]